MNDWRAMIQSTSVFMSELLMDELLEKLILPILPGFCDERVTLSIVPSSVILIPPKE
jgi:hypothetical protein